jgi:hypothetical protein
MDAALTELTGGFASRVISGTRAPGAAPAPAATTDDGPSVDSAGKGDSITLSAAAQRALGGEQAAPNDGEDSADDDGKDGDKAAEAGAARGADGEPLDEDEVREVERLKKRDQEVRTHEQAHQAAGGAHAGAASYDTEKGPDGASYATAGEVPIDTAPVSGNPAATIAKMEQVKRAALAPAEPSAADRAIAAKADQARLRAQRELAEQQAEEAQQPEAGEAPLFSRRGALVSVTV